MVRAASTRSQDQISPFGAARLVATESATVAPNGGGLPGTGRYNRHAMVGPSRISIPRLVPMSPQRRAEPREAMPALACAELPQGDPGGIAGHSTGAGRSVDGVNPARRGSPPAGLTTDPDRSIGDDAALTCISGAVSDSV